MDATTVQALDDALALAEDAVQVSLGFQTKVAQLETQIVGEKVLLEKVASLEKRPTPEAVDALVKQAKASTVTFDPALLSQAAQVIVRVGGGEEADAAKIASSIAGDPNVAIQLLIKVASGMPRMKALNEGGGVKPADPVEGDGRWV